MPPTTLGGAPSSRLAQLRDRALDLGSKRALRTEERVVAHVEPEHLLLEGKPEILRVLVDGDLDALLEPDGLARGAGVREQAHDPGVALSSASERPVDDLLVRLHQRLAGVIE